MPARSQVWTAPSAPGTTCDEVRATAPCRLRCAHRGLVVIGRDWTGVGGRVSRRRLTCSDARIRGRCRRGRHPAVARWRRACGYGARWRGVGRRVTRRRIGLRSGGLRRGGWRGGRHRHGGRNGARGHGGWRRGGRRCGGRRGAGGVNDSGWTLRTRRRTAAGRIPSAGSKVRVRTGLPSVSSVTARPGPEIRASSAGGVVAPPADRRPGRRFDPPSTIRKSLRSYFSRCPQSSARGET